jgi:hypothetical protein
VDGWGLSEGLVIGGVTGAGYFAAYRSNVGYKGYFGSRPCMQPEYGDSIRFYDCLYFVASFVGCHAAACIRRYGTWILPVLLTLGVLAVIGQKKGTRSICLGPFSSFLLA